MKKCCHCNLMKDESSFSKHSKTKDNLQTICKLCSSNRSKIYYKNNPIEHKKVVAERRKTKRIQSKQKIDEIKQICLCANCNESDIICLEFHHIESENKHFNIGESYSYEWKWSTILKEIEKCVCLCANCHRKVHAHRFEITPNMMCKTILDNSN